MFFKSRRISLVDRLEIEVLNHEEGRALMTLPSSCKPNAKKITLLEHRGLTCPTNLAPLITSATWHPDSCNPRCCSSYASYSHKSYHVSRTQIP
jgi:hypothetical protein